MSLASFSLEILEVADDVQWGSLDNGDWYRVTSDPVGVARIKMTPSGANNAIKMPGGEAVAQANTDVVTPLEVTATAQPAMEPSDAEV